MEEVTPSQVSFMLDTNMPGDYEVDCRGQHVIIHQLRLGKGVNLTLRGMHIRFRQMPKVSGSLKIVSGGNVFFPSEKAISNIDLKTVGGRKVWDASDPVHDLDGLDDLQPPAKLKTDAHNVAHLSLFTKLQHNISLTLPKCSLMVNETETTSDEVTVNLDTGNIWIIGEQKVKGTFSATNSWTVAKDASLGNGLKLVSSNRVWPSEEKVELHSPFKNGVLNSFHLDSWKK